MEVKNVTYFNTTNLTVVEELFDAAGLPEVICFSLLFLIIGFVGISGNGLVIYVVISNKKMRQCATNLMICNLALADLVIMMFGIPEIVQFMINRGWIFDLLTCKINRYIMVSSLYTSVLTLVAVCIERYVGIIHPLKAYVLCHRKRISVVIGVIWVISCLAGIPTLTFNEVLPGQQNDTSLKFCMMSFPAYHKTFFLVFKFSEFVIFYLGPLIIQVILYATVSKHLFVKTDQLHRKLKSFDESGTPIEVTSEAVQARRGVVKMLILSVLVYFLSYSPQQILLFYHVIYPATFQSHWSLQVCVMIVAYINSAVNPIFYSIFSQNFRNGFKRVLCCEKDQRKITYTSSCRLGRFMMVSTS
ncbi:hypothetical protein LOTGIDRAFT_126644 [Lottia gigantea]|uniref:G-protein coupled receptors family 1 profile domain-containing protein n=1 Tax=Lottia gigantea TaxID=225164 RepID=V4A4H9_LOTGI|nr:hypothetical protein LOTGIDRAFT_126644 [Lottia gigantea]ESO88166.1 hypothetical protein LOTGIDRAFT_126644 [Lottia gigantea]